jgi:hypothetical protein
LVLGLLAASLVASAQSNIWKPVENRETDFLVRAVQQLDHYASFDADPFVLRNTLRFAPMETVQDFEYVVWMPNPEGEIERFRLFESPIQSQAVAVRTGVRTYGGQGIDDPTAIAKFDIGRNGFHGMVISTRGTYYIEPLSLGEPVRHIVFYSDDYLRDWDFSCIGPVVSERPRVGRGGGQEPMRPGPNRKDYRLALKGTGEYTAYYGGVANADAGSVTIMNRVNGVYEKDLSIRMLIVTLTNFPNPATDPYTNNNGFTMLGQNQTECDANPGNANYDIGHVFSTGGGGVAGLQVVGITGQKARGVTGLPSPVGDPFAIDYVAHEMGHQYGANHSFNGTTSACGGGNRSGGSAYEPGSGSTIMAYAGICGAENVQFNSDDYFHAVSQASIEAWRNNAGSGGTVVGTGNISPVVNAGLDYTIPRDTPFRLTASASDGNGDTLTYCWEQYNLGPATPPVNELAQPLFRSQRPSTFPTRWFPKQATVLSNGTDIWENLPSVDRSMTFRCTVRDNRANGGNYEWDATVISVSGAAFAVTAPNTPVNWQGNSTQTVTWTVGGGAVAPNVRILLSTNGGNSYYNGTATVLVASTPNDGSEQITVPNVGTNQARIFVEAVNNVFYDVSNVNFTITPVTAQIVNPTSYTVVEGTENVHDLNALLLSDDVWLPVVGNYLNVQTVAIEYVATAPNMTVNRLSFILECHSIDTTRLRYIDLWNYNTSSWEQIGSSLGTFNDSTFKVDVTTDPTRFIDPSTRQMKARTRMLSLAALKAFLSLTEYIDRTVWELSS